MGSLDAKIKSILYVYQNSTPQTFRASPSSLRCISALSFACLLSQYPNKNKLEGLMALLRVRLTAHQNFLP